MLFFVSFYKYQAMGVPHWCILNVPGTDTITGQICTAWSLVCLGVFYQVHEFIILCWNFLFILIFTSSHQALKARRRMDRKTLIAPKLLFSCTGRAGLWTHCWEGGKYCWSKIKKYWSYFINFFFFFFFFGHWTSSD